MLYFVPSLIVVGYKPFYKTMCVAKILSVSTVVVVDDDNRFPGKKTVTLLEINRLKVDIFSGEARFWRCSLNGGTPKSIKTKWIRLRLPPKFEPGWKPNDVF